MTAKNLDAAGRKRFAKRTKHLARAKPTPSQKKAFEDEEKKVAEGDRRIGPEDRRARHPVNYRYDALNPEFEKMLAMIASYADEKYTDCHLYAKLPDRLRGEKSPINHMREHLRQYIMQEPYDKFDGDLGWHLAAVAYNAMMELFYLRRFGPVKHALVLDHPSPIRPFNINDSMRHIMFGAAMTSVANLLTESIKRGRKKRKKKR